MAKHDQVLAELARALPDDREALLDAAKGAVCQFHEAAIVEDMAAFEQARLLREAITWKLNGGSSFGTNAGENSPGYVVERHCAATPGEVPMWGQRGQFIITVRGIRAMIDSGDSFGFGMCHFSFHAVDRSKPFISETGYRSHFMPFPFGYTVKEAAEAVLEEFIESQGRKVIEPRYRDREIPSWIEANDIVAPATYQETNGQGAFGF
ncbi:hypothetical protein KYK30_31365 [Shinella yambaruensis]|uniref:Uncharacterized protein n=1 Tax=Shinella yambaruensis TaxID=415996 RepID=A0ABQ5ZWY7_9HYPH|nr:hypothetical protein [Shinella yambaruensis]MCJ8029979.1 hypothetical protein [Shinella yambaruensis]MCU7984223.1 hypothetical protein [Shinella yambaruensis]GLR55179.1 hypothetical protein GCM10007923_64010 [Shinella yambaruensis]